MQKNRVLQGFFMIFLHFDSANSFANGGNRISPKSFSRAAKVPAAQRSWPNPPHIALTLIPSSADKPRVRVPPLGGFVFCILQFSFSNLHFAPLTFPLSHLPTFQ